MVLLVITLKLGWGHLLEVVALEAPEIIEVVFCAALGSCVHRPLGRIAHCGL